jgi:hypothetical protein
VIDGAQNLTLGAVEYLQNFASARLPVIFSGEAPLYFASGNDSREAYDAALSVLKSSPYVYSVDEGQLSSQLLSQHLNPRVETRTNGTWYTTFTETDDASYVFIFADLVASQGNITVSDTRNPYWLNPWTGETLPVVLYNRFEDSLVIPLSLAGNQTAILAFSKEINCHVPDPIVHVTSSSPYILGADVKSEDSLTLHVTHTPSSVDVALSNGSIYEVDASTVPPPFDINDWTLVAEHWEAPKNISSDSLDTVKYNTTHNLTSLQNWVDIPALVNVSGIGYYTATLEWPPKSGTNINGTALGAYVSFGRIVHSIKVLINDNQLPPIDLNNAIVDVSSYLRNGTNSVTVIVPTTLSNYLFTILDELRSAGNEPFLLLWSTLGLYQPQPKSSGLLGPVTVTPVALLDI